MKKVAVILPVYKNDKVPYVHLSVDSILNQTYQGEIVLYIGVDGPVGDDLATCLKEYEAKGVKVQWFEENRGLAVVLNDLLDMAFEDGFEYIARMDADDISMPDRFEKQMALFAEHPEYDVVGGFISWIDENGNSCNKIIKKPKTPEESLIFFETKNPLAHPAVLFKKTFFQKAGCKYRPDHKKNQDTLLWYDGLKKGVKIANVQEVILFFRVTEAMFAHRRSGKAQAKIQLKDRIMINKGLHYGLKAYVYAYCVYIVMIVPTWVRKYIYKVFR